MRFFNDARADRDDPDDPPADRASADPPDRGTGLTHPVEPMPAGLDGRDGDSAHPADRPDDADASLADNHPDTDERGDNGDVVHPREQETAFGAGTVGGAVAVSADAAGAVPRADSDRADADGDGTPVTDEPSATDEFHTDRDETRRDDEDDPPRHDAENAEARHADEAEARQDAHDDQVRRDTVDGAGAWHDDKDEDDGGDDEAAGDTAGDEARLEAPDGAVATHDHTAEEPGPDRAGDPSAAPVVAAAGATGLWGEGRAEGFRDRWREVQLRFVDDPATAAREAKALVSEAVDGLTMALAEHRERLDDWESTPGDETERLRVAVRGYRDFLDRLLDR